MDRSPSQEEFCRLAMRGRNYVLLSERGLACWNLRFRIIYPEFAASADWAASRGLAGLEIATVTHERVLVTSPPPRSPESSRAAQLLKDAVLMKKEKRFDDACASLREALSIGGIESGGTKEKPAYCWKSGYWSLGQDQVFIDWPSTEVAVDLNDCR